MNDAYKEKFGFPDLRRQGAHQGDDPRRRREAAGAFPSRRDRDRPGRDLQDSPSASGGSGRRRLITANREEPHEFSASNAWASGLGRGASLRPRTHLPDGGRPHAPRGRAVPAQRRARDGRALWGGDLRARDGQAPRPRDEPRGSFELLGRTRGDGRYHDRPAGGGRLRPRQRGKAGLRALRQHRAVRDALARHPGPA